MNPSIAEDYRNNRVGPVLRAGDVADAAIEAAQEDNPGREIHVDDRTAYIRIDTDGELILRRTTLQKALGRTFRMAELEVNLATFSGRIETDTEFMRFYYDKRL